MAEAAMATGTCVECGGTFEYRPRGIAQATCSEPCRSERERRQADVRRERWIQRRVQAALADARTPL